MFAEQTFIVFYKRANSDFKIGALKIRIFADYAYYAGVFKLLAWSDPHTEIL